MRSLGDVLFFFGSFRILCLLCFSALTLHWSSADDHAPLALRPFPSLFRAKETTRKQKHPGCRLAICNDQFATFCFYPCFCSPFACFSLFLALLFLFVSFLSIYVIRYISVFSGLCFNPTVFAELRWTLHDGDLDFTSVDAGELELEVCRCDILFQTALEFAFVATASVQYPPRCNLKQQRPKRSQQHELVRRTAREIQANKHPDEHQVVFPHRLGSTRD
jgi:hypothetical protein